MQTKDVPQNDNFNNSIAWVAWGHIPKEAIDLIEILRGPSSSLYGSEGPGGVINIIAKNPGENRAASLQAKAGNAATLGGNAFFRQELGLNQYTVNYSHLFNTIRFRGTVFLNQADKTAFQDNIADNYMPL